MLSEKEGQAKRTKETKGGQEGSREGHGCQTAGERQAEP